MVGSSRPGNSGQLLCTEQARAEFPEWTLDFCSYTERSEKRGRWPCRSVISTLKGGATDGRVPRPHSSSWLQEVLHLPAPADRFIVISWCTQAEWLTSKSFQSSCRRTNRRNGIYMASPLNKPLYYFSQVSYDWKPVFSLVTSLSPLTA